MSLIKLNEAPMVTAQLTDVEHDAIQIGMLVEMVTRKMRNEGKKRRMIVYGYKFRPSLHQPQPTA
ncbi:MAG: hypothetical protein JW963_14130 [Anaerolineales bacterium]|nr:hypothetical protein [Anaerolineales bacterium]